MGLELPCSVHISGSIPSSFKNLDILVHSFFPAYGPHYLPPADNFRYSYLLYLISQILSKWIFLYLPSHTRKWYMSLSQWDFQHFKKIYSLTSASFSTIILFGAFIPNRTFEYILIERGSQDRPRHIPAIPIYRFFLNQAGGCHVSGPAAGVIYIPKLDWPFQATSVTAIDRGLSQPEFLKSLPWWSFPASRKPLAPYFPNIVFACLS